MSLLALPQNRQSLKLKMALGFTEFARPTGLTTEGPENTEVEYQEQLPLTLDPLLKLRFLIGSLFRVFGVFRGSS